MDTQSQILREAKDYCETAGISLSTFGHRAFGNARFFERLNGRIEYEQIKLSEIRAFIENNPVASRQHVEHGADPESLQGKEIPTQDDTPPKTRGFRVYEV